MSISRRRFRVDGTFDIECADWDKFQIGCVYSPQRDRILRSPTEFVDELLTRSGTYWAHAGGIYDLLLVAENLRNRGIRYHADLAQHRITRLVVGGLTLRDSYAIVPFPLDEAAAIAGEKAPELPWSCICRRKCGGYCQIGKRAKLGDPELEHYCREDCRVLFRVLEELAVHAQMHDIDLRGTLGSTAWATAQDKLGLPDSELAWDTWRRIRRADKGGRLFVGRPFARGPGVHFDIRNAYPGALARAPIPIGRPRELGGRRARAALLRDRPGIYSATVRVPPMHVPPLPWRHGNRMLYPTGTFSGSWALPELVAAVARGAVIEDVHHAIIWPVQAPLFADLMAEWYAIRRKVGKETPLGQWQSRLAKALTGKFAELPDRARIVCHPDPEKIKWCNRTGRCRNGCHRRCGAYDQLDILGYVWEAPYWKLAPSGHAHWSAYLRAHTRIQWLEAAERYAPGDLAYGDTDSIWVTGNTLPDPIGPELGQWELKHTWTELDIRAPKVYRFLDGDDRAILRGAPGLTDADWRRGKATIDRGVRTFKQAVGGGDGRLFRRKDRRWTLPGAERDPVWYGDRKLDPISGITYPADAKEHRERYDLEQASRTTARQEKGRGKPHSGQRAQARRV